MDILLVSEKKKILSMKDWAIIAWKKYIKIYWKQSLVSELQVLKSKDLFIKMTEALFKVLTICLRYKICQKTVKLPRLNNKWMTLLIRNIIQEFLLDTTIQK